MPTTRVIITVPPRPEFDNAFWAIQKRFPSGTTVLDVTDEELLELQAAPVIGLTIASDVATPAGDPATDAAAKAAADAAATDAAKSPGKPLKR